MKTNLLYQLSQLRRTQTRASLLDFTKLYLADHIQKAPSPAHAEIYSLLMDLLKDRGRKLAIAAPRGFGKSTLVTLAYILYGICFGHEKFIVILSATASQAEQFLENVKRELENNKKLLMDFPELTGSKPRPWTRSEVVTPSNVRLLALGGGQRIRGRKFGKDRPTLVIADDLENAENTFSLESREKLKEWFNSSVLKAGSEGTNFLFLGTLHHPYSLLGEYVNPEFHPEWTKRVYRVILSYSAHPELWEKWSQIYNGREAWDEKRGPVAARNFYEANQKMMDEGTQVLWPDRWTYYELMVVREEEPISFSSELQNEPINPKDCTFDVDGFTYWDSEYRSVDELLRAIGDEVEFYGACDPSLGLDTMRGDYTAIVMLARDPKMRIFYVIVADIRRCTPTETIEAIFAYYSRYRFRSFAIETNQFQELLAQDVERRGQERGLYPHIERVKHSSDKTKRIQSLHSWFKNGWVRLSKKHTMLLEQAKFFPKGKYDDGLDALEMAVRLAEEEGGWVGLHVINLRDPDQPPGWDVKWHEL